MSSRAQENIAKSELLGSSEYTRLEETKRDYEKAMAKGDSLEVAEVCYRLGKRYIYIGDFYNSEKWFTRALRILEPRGYSEALGKVYTFMSNFLIRNNQYDEAITIAQKSVKNFKSVNALERLSGAYLMLGTIHAMGHEVQLKNPKKYRRYSLDSANYYRNLAYQTGLKLKKSTDTGAIDYTNRNTFFYSDTLSLIKEQKRKYAYFLKQKSSSDLFSYAASIGQAYLLKANFAEAKNWLNKASIIADTANVGNYDQKLELFKMLFELNKQTHNYKEALKYHELFHDLIRQSINSDRNGAVSRLKIEYETEKKEAKLQEQKKLTIIAILIGAFAVLASLVFFWFFRKYKTLSKENEALVSEQNHRVKNNLQQVTNLLSLQSSRLKDETAKRAVNDALLRIETVSMVHHRLYDGERLIEINLSDFIPELTKGILRSYDYSGLQPHYQIDNLWLHVEQAMPLGLIINELVTNACKYAFPGNADAGLSISCHEKEGQIVLQLSDNGPGFDIDTVKRTFGLKLIQIFTEKLKGKSNFESKQSTFHLTFKKKSLNAKKNYKQPDL